MINLSKISFDVSEAWEELVSKDDLIVYERDITYDEDDYDRDEKYICVVELDNFLYMFSITVVDGEEHVTVTQKYEYEDFHYIPFTNHSNYQEIDSDSEMRSKIIEFVEDKTRHGYKDYEFRENSSINFEQAVRKVKSEI